MKFNIFGIIIMAMAIGLGTAVGSAIATMIGFAGTVVGTFVVGAMCYVVYALVMGLPLNVWLAILFAVSVWLANLFAGAVSGYTGLGGGIVGLFVTAVIASLIWGYIGGKGSPITPSQSKKSTRRKGRR